MEILTSGQRRFLQALGGRDFFRSNFILTGGTALAAFYLEHRFSEDLDFFTGDELVAARMKPEFDAVVTQNAFTAEIHRHFPTFLEAGVRCGDETIAVHLALDSPYRLEPAVAHPEISFFVESALDLAANKLAALYGRASAKDFVDLYFIHHELMPIEKLLPFAAQKSPGIEPYWLSRAFLQVRLVETLPKMLKPLTIEHLREFFLKKAEEVVTGNMH